MNINLIWINDPKDGKPSVSLTNLVVSILFLSVTMTLHLMDKVKDTSMSFEYFGASAALYFGRRVTFTNGDAIDKESNDQ